MLCFAKSCLKTCSTNQLTFFRSLIALILITSSISFLKGKISFINYIKTNQIKLQLIRGISALASVYLCLLALKTASIAEVSLISNTTPIFIPLIGFIWKKSPINHKIWPGIFLTILGIFFLLHPESGKSSTPGIWITLIGTIIGGVAIKALEFAHNTEPLCRSVFYYTLLSSLVTGFFCFIEGFSLDFLFDSIALISLLAVGVTGFLFQMLFALSLKYAPPEFITPFSHISIIFGVLLDVIFWKKPLLLIEVAGIALVIGGLYLVHGLMKSKEKKQPV